MSVDQSITCTGVCIFEDEKLIHFECIKTTNDESNVARISYIASRLLDLFNEYKCDDFVTESLAYGSIGDATRNLAGLLFAIEVKLYEQLGIDTVPKVTPTSVKKFATGYGGSAKKKVTKKDMMAALPEDVYNDFYNAGYLRSKGLADLADAYFIGLYYIDKFKTDVIEVVQIDELTELK